MVLPNKKIKARRLFRLTSTVVYATAFGGTAPGPFSVPDNHENLTGVGRGIGRHKHANLASPPAELIS